MRTHPLVLPLGVVLVVVLAGCAAPTATGGGPATPGPIAEGGPADGVDIDGPPAPQSDRLGWEGGYWYNDSLSVDTGDGVNATERRAIVNRAMARVERIRGLEFRETVSVRVVSKEGYRGTAGGENHSADFRRFDNAKFEALFLIGEDEDSLASQESTIAQAVRGYYDSANGSIVIVAETSDGGDATTALPDETTLAHELVHALQDQHYDLSSYERRTREEYNANNGLIEGDASRVDQEYRSRCGEDDGDWDCYLPESDGDGGSEDPEDFNLGVYILEFFPYSDGPGFVAYHEERGGRERVDDLYADPPASTEQVIYPEKYGEDEPVSVDLEDRTRDGWERVRLPDRDRPDHAVLGQSALASSFGYTAFDEYNNASVISAEQFLNLTPLGTVDSSDPFIYSVGYVRGWEGDRMHVYSRGDETASVWKTVWESEVEAKRFARGYRRLLGHWGGTHVKDDVWRIESGPFADAFSVRVEGDTVVLVSAPTTEDLGSVRPSEGDP